MRLLGHYDAVADMVSWFEPTDENGHGSHVAGVAVNSSELDKTGFYRGIAPDADLVAVKAFDATGRGSYADVIRGIDWVVTHKDDYGIRVLNLSFSAEPRSRYWDDPLNQAVMAAWEAGIAVVASAGNTGPGAMTIGVPGNVPYVITVGAMTDNYTPEDLSDDRLTSFSSAGPTKEAFVKPDLVAPGGHLSSVMGQWMTIPLEHPEFYYDGMYFTMSGTSQAAGVVTGIVALMLQHSPWLTPDEVEMPTPVDLAPGDRRGRKPRVQPLSARCGSGRCLRGGLQRGERLRKPGSRRRQGSGRYRALLWSGSTRQARQLHHRRTRCVPLERCFLVERCLFVERRVSVERRLSLE